MHKQVIQTKAENTPLPHKKENKKSTSAQRFTNDRRKEKEVNQRSLGGF
ncbi:MAG TPA: hypothetical protein VK144_01060 [Bacillota bacterium]|nr:hypothetical protein [Bacillota bacterium]